MNWTDERIAEMKRLWELGLSCSQIAAQLGHVTRNAVIGKLTRLGLTGGPSHKPKPAPKPQPQRRVRIRRQRTEPRFPPLTVVASEEPEIAPDVCPNRVSLLEATEGQCRWPAADDGSASMVCGNQTVDGHSWCLGHCRVAYEPRSVRSGPRRSATINRIREAV